MYYVIEFKDVTSPEWIPCTYSNTRICLYSKRVAAEKDRKICVSIAKRTEADKTFKMRYRISKYTLQRIGT